MPCRRWNSKPPAGTPAARASSITAATVWALWVANCGARTSADASRRARAGDVGQVGRRLAGIDRIALEPRLLGELDLGVPVGALDQAHRRCGGGRPWRGRRASRAPRGRASGRPGPRCRARPNRPQHRTRARSNTSRVGSRRAASSASTVRPMPLALASWASSPSRPATSATTRGPFANSKRGWSADSLTEIEGAPAPPPVTVRPMARIASA